jgi:hypothetical protein
MAALMSPLWISDALWIVMMVRWNPRQTPTVGALRGR